MSDLILEFSDLIINSDAFLYMLIPVLQILKLKKFFQNSNLNLFFI